VCAGLFAFAGSCGSGGDDSVTGVIVEVDAPSLTELASFTFHTDGGETLTFVPAPDADRESSEALVPGHLQSHALVGSKVEVFYREEGGALLALRIEDR
jgi:hypothetical protein